MFIFSTLTLTSATLQSVCPEGMEKHRTGRDLQGHQTCHDCWQLWHSGVWSNPNCSFSLDSLSFIKVVKKVVRKMGILKHRWKNRFCSRVRICKWVKSCGSLPEIWKKANGNFAVAEGYFQNEWRFDCPGASSVFLLISMQLLLGLWRHVCLCV